MQLATRHKLKRFVKTVLTAFLCLLVFGGFLLAIFCGWISHVRNEKVYTARPAITSYHPESALGSSVKSKIRKMLAAREHGEVREVPFVACEINEYFAMSEDLRNQVYIRLRPEYITLEISLPAEGKKQAGSYVNFELDIKVISDAEGGFDFAEHEYKVKGTEDLPRFVRDKVHREFLARYISGVEAELKKHLKLFCSVRLTKQRLWLKLKPKD